MHDYMRAIGFSKEYSREGYRKLLSDVVNTCYERREVAKNEGVVRVEYKKLYGRDVGVIVRGTLEPGSSGTDEIFVDYAVPFVRTAAISSTEKVTFEKFSDGEEYYGICDDYRLGMPLIFYLQNMNEYLESREDWENSAIDVMHVSLSALSLNGTIMIPIEKSREEEEELRKKRQIRENLVRRARVGDESAVENMTIEDMDTYSNLRKRSQKEDVFSLVDSYFMPSGVESDKYAILGEIKDVTENINTVTGETVYVMDIVADDVFFTVCINEADLVGEPEIGRRFKGVIWMQGSVGY